MATFLSQKIPKMFTCNICDYNTSNQKDYNKHLKTKKHISNSSATNGNNLSTPKILICDNCKKEYSTRSGLWRHKSKCKIENITNDKDEIIQMLIKQNSELLKEQADIKHIILEIIQNGTHNNICNNTNSNNKSFNLNLEDLENTGRKGYIEGISSIILKNLNNLERHMRPLHCSDLKREILYVKDNNQWSKETEEKPILTKAIKTIANENIKQIKNWRNKNPDCTNYDSKKNNLYLKIVSNSMNGLTEEEGNKNINKIISNLAKEVIIDKN
jgi:hypothetical protein